MPLHDDLKPVPYAIINVFKRKKCLSNLTVCVCPECSDIKDVPITEFKCAAVLIIYVESGSGGRKDQSNYPDGHREAAGCNKFNAFSPAALGRESHPLRCRQ